MKNFSIKANIKVRGKDEWIENPLIKKLNAMTNKQRQDYFNKKAEEKNKKALKKNPFSLN